MKKNFLVLAIVLAGFFTAQAQVNPHAIGLRFGGGTAFGGELSGSVQKSVYGKNVIYNFFQREPIK
jgi:hypothetical protein